jgi:hypothetical protein
MTRAAGLSIPELRRWGLVYAGLAVALFVALGIWPAHARDRVEQSRLPKLLSYYNFRLDVVHDPESGQTWIWDQPTSWVNEPQNEAQRSGDAASREMERRVARGELERHAQYGLRFGWVAAPYMPWSDVPLWYSNTVTARFVEYDEDTWRSHDLAPAIPEPAPGLAASGPRAFKATWADWFPDQVAALDRIGVGGVERVGVIAGVGYHLGLLANLLLAIAALFASGWCFLRMFLMRAHAGPHGACLRCGYPITTAGQERCSECGGELASPAA